tara:strand:- start:546 stop:800 length:255 start_codon:yes stop_codon:yes gene_type:complete
LAKAAALVTEEEAWSMSGRRRWDGRETLRGIGTEVRRGSGAPIVGYSGRLVPRLSGIQLAAASDGIDIRNNRVTLAKIRNNFVE